MDADISESLSFLSNDLKPQISKLTFLKVESRERAAKRSLSHGATQNMPHLVKKLSKSCFRDPSEQGFFRISELGSPYYIHRLSVSNDFFA